LLENRTFAAVENCLWVYGRYVFDALEENVVNGSRSKIDYVALVDGEPKALCEAKSPSVMKKVGESLPPHGIELKWVIGQSLVPKILTKVSLLFPVGYNTGLK